uniref:M6 family metalloprotease domain-containing protein n=1 Tax=Prevotella sp. TaxID=59823 RepID=UPI0040269376
MNHAHNHFRTIIFRLSLIVALLAFTCPSRSVPAKRGVWRTVTLSNGLTVKARLCGDEHAHWWQAEDGSCFDVDSLGKGKAVVPQELMSKVRSRMAARRQAARRANAKKASQRIATNGNTGKFQGQRHGLIILVNFADSKFNTSKFGPTQTLYSRIANEANYGENNFKGSISDYFKAQSGGQFLLDFDVAGPVTLPHRYSYYGQNDDDGYDMRPKEMVKEACQAVDGSVDFSKYDWDGDGEVEEVFVVYAGNGEHDTTNQPNLIWPHMDNLANYKEQLTLDGVTINTYACASELNSDKTLSGIGTFCHEFSHCMGFPDMYDTASDGNNFGMGSWDLMDYGSYNGDGYVPAGYSGYEKMVCGWTTPIELDKPMTVNGMERLADMGQTYIIYNKGNRNEYYILENRQQSGFDKYLPGSGLLIERVDYDKDIWEWNAVNTTNGGYYPEGSSTPSYNDHQRITIFHANNIEYDGNNATYPYASLDSLTDSSQPAATVWNANADGTYLMHCRVYGITQNADGTVAFSFGRADGNATGTNDSILFKETFDKCAGTGGNDGKFSGNIAFSVFEPDNDGWKHIDGLTGNYMYGANTCARFGNSSKSISGWVVSPAFTLQGDTAVISFRAAGWNTEAEGTSLDVSVSGTDAKLLDNGNLTMKKGEWTTYSLRVKGSGRCTITFMPGKRFFLDDVMVKREKPKASIGISGVRHADGKAAQAVYTLDGRRVGYDLRALPHGIYIVGGKKIAK